MKHQKPIYEDNDEEKDDSKDYAPRRRRRNDSDMGKVPRKKPKGNTDIQQYITRSKNTDKMKDQKKDQETDGTSSTQPTSLGRDIEATKERDASNEEIEEKGFDCPFCKKKIIKIMLALKHIK